MKVIEDRPLIDLSQDRFGREPLVELVVESINHGFHLWIDVLLFVDRNHLALLGDHLSVLVKSKRIQSEILNLIQGLGNHHAIEETGAIDQGVGVTTEDGIELRKLLSGLDIRFKATV